MRDHQPLKMEDFRGFWQRGDAEACPPEYQTEFINWRTVESGFETRDGLAPANGLTNTLRIYPYFDAPAGDGYLELRSNNIIYHMVGNIGGWSTFQVCNAIPGMTDFGFISINGRAFISPSTNQNLSGLPGEFIYVYLGDHATMMRKAAGGPPHNVDGALAAANSGSAGNVEKGIHVFGVVYETNTGFLSQIGPETLATVTADGSHAVDLSGIPRAGGSTVAKRHIVASKLIDPTTYNGDTRGYELFFVPGGTINDNTSTNTTVNFFDSELIVSAAHLLDLREDLPACGGLGTYHNRMLAWDYDGGIHICLVSNAGDPESFDSVSGLIEVPREGTGITWCQEYRDVLYVMKFNKMVAFNDNGDVPTSWPSANIDQGLGCGKHGISTVGIYGGTNIESFIQINDQGVYIFTGSLNSPELSYAIKDFWATITPLNINVGQVSGYTDTLHQFIFIVIPQYNTVLVGDYANGLSPDKIKWSKWLFTHSMVTLMLWDKTNILFLGCDVGVHYINNNATADTYNGAAAAKIPDPTYISAYLPPADDDDIYHFTGVRYRVVGTANLASSLLGLDTTVSANLASLPISNSPGKEPFLLGNLVSQKARIQIKTLVINESAKFNRITLYTRGMYSGHPL